MDWYYVVNNERKGPVEQTEFDRLFREGTILGSTLVWREGMAEWRPYAEIASTSSNPETGAATGGVICSECGKTFASDQLIRLGNRHVCAACKPIATQKLLEGVLDHGDPEQIRKQHIKHEASVRSIGILYYLGAACMLFAGLFGAVAADRDSARSGPWLIAVFFGFALVQIWLGIGIRGLNSWARVPSGILSGLGLLAFPIGTLINAYILYLLFSKKGATVFSEEYKRVMQQTPHIKYRMSVVIWILLVILIVVIGLLVVGFLFAPRR